jgi:NAD(P)H-dependent FMN reductase
MNTQTTKKIGVIVASTRPGRSADKVKDWFMPQTDAFKDKARFELIDLKEVNLPFLDEPKSAMTGEYTLDHTKAWSEKIKGFDEFIIVTAEYNHGYPAPLKNALDYLYHEWANKPVAFVNYGYTASGTRATEQLRQVMVQLQMININTQVSISLPEFFAATDMTPWNNQAQKMLEKLVSKL